MNKKEKEEWKKKVHEMCSHYAPWSGPWGSHPDPRHYQYPDFKCNGYPCTCESGIRTYMRRKQ